MIATFKNFGLHIVEPNLDSLVKKGFDVFVKEDGKTLKLAILGNAGIQPETSDVSSFGFQRTTNNNRRILENRMSGLRRVNISEAEIELWLQLSLRHVRLIKGRFFM